MSKLYTGTVAELVKTLKVNGEAVSAPELSILLKFGNGSFARRVGSVKQPEGKRGKPATIWEVDATASLNIEV